MDWFITFTCTSSFGNTFPELRVTSPTLALGTGNGAKGLHGYFARFWDFATRTGTGTGTGLKRREGKKHNKFKWKLIEFSLQSLHHRAPYVIGTSWSWFGLTYVSYSGSDLTAGLCHSRTRLFIFKRLFQYIYFNRTNRMNSKSRYK
jgi:hypothetical protein